MPYASNADLPAAVKNALPAAAQSVFRTVVNNALKEYKGDDAKANATAWAALKSQGWQKDASGNWHKVWKIISKNSKQQYTLGVVYEPDVFDTDNEFTDAAEIEKACWEFNLNLQAQSHTAKIAGMVIEQIQKLAEEEVSLDITDLWDEIEKGAGVNDMHETDLDDCDVLESYIAPADMVIGSQAVKKGTWLMGIKWSPSMFAKIESGERTGYSMGGTARKVAA